MTYIKKSVGMLVVVVTAVSIVVSVTVVQREADAQGTSTTVAVAGSLAFDAKDDNTLVHSASNVFVGRVVKKIGPPKTTSESDIPLTLSSVEVIENVKGDLSGRVVVSQMGSADKDVTVEDSAPLFKPGREYLLVVNPDRRSNADYLLVAGSFGSIPINSAKERATLVERFRRITNDQKAPDRRAPSQGSTYEGTTPASRLPGTGGPSLLPIAGLSLLTSGILCILGLRLRTRTL